MTNKETKEYLLKWCKEKRKLGYVPLFEWCTDACGYDQHIKFAKHRNKNWKGGTLDEFIDFVEEYAKGLPDVD